MEMQALITQPTPWRKLGFEAKDVGQRKLPGQTQNMEEGEGLWPKWDWSTRSSRRESPDRSCWSDPPKCLHLGPLPLFHSFLNSTSGTYGPIQKQNDFVILFTDVSPQHMSSEPAWYTVGSQRTFIG